MPLFSAKKLEHVKKDSPPLTSEDDRAIAELIKRRRLQMLVHSCIYYELNANVISDHTFDEWGKELAKLQNDYPHISKQVIWYKEFIGWDGSTGAFLPLRHPWVMGTALYILRIHNKRR